MVQNPNWPVIDLAVSWPAGPNQSPLQPLWMSVLERTETQLSGTRGKQYELDQVQPGQYKTVLRNDDGVFDPDNTASPYAGYVIPYRLFRARAQWPATQNLLTPDQATAGRAEAGLGTGSVLPADVASWGGASVSVFNLTPTLNQYIVGYPVSPALFTGLAFTGWSVNPGQVYTISGVVNASANVGISMYFAIQWIAADGVTVVATSNGTPAVVTTALSPLTITAAAPANAAGARLIWLNSNSPATAVSVGLRTLQLEKASTASAYTQPGHWYPIFTGYIERWPQTWSSQGNYGTVALTIVDYFANLANHGLLAPFKADLMALGPNFLYALDEAVGTNAFADTAGKRGPAVVSTSSVGNTVASGASIASADNAPPGPDFGTALTGAFLGTAGPTLQTAFPPTTVGQVTAFGGGAVQIPANPATGLVGPPATGGYTRIIAGRLTAIPGSQAIAWAFQGPAGGVTVAAVINPVGSPSYLLSASGGAATGSANINLPVVSNSAGVLLDSDWHLYSLSLSADGKTLSIRADSGLPVVVTAASSMSPAPGIAAAGNLDIIGAQLLAGQYATQWPGNLALACELPFEMTNAIWSNLTQSWRNAWSTVSGNVETTDERYQRILNWINYTGTTRISPGLCKSVGPATDVATSPTQPALALTALENITETEGGSHFIAADGAVVFQSRADRYNKTPTVTFGELDGSGEYPYLNAATDYDPTQVGNDVQITAAYGNAVYRQQDGPSSNPATSQGKYGVVTFTRTVNSIDPNELTAASQFYLAQRKDPATRLQALTFDVGANPSLWPILLGLELGQCAAFNRRPSNAPKISLTGFIEQIGWTLDDQVRASCTVQISNTKGRNSFGQYGTKRYAPDAGSIKPSAAMTAGQTTVTLVTTGGTPITNSAGAFPADILIDNEQITLTAASGSATSPQTFTIVRGVNGTTAASHPTTSAIRVAAPSQYAY